MKIKGIEGLRSISVVLIILFHLFPSTVKGGYLGVDIFLVISGFLVTESLAKEYLKNGRVNLNLFYKKRIRRITPSFLVLLLLTIFVVTVINHNAIGNIRGTFWSNFFYVNNWWQIFFSEGYFAQAISWQPLTHLWSISVEMQFYIIWPLVFLIMTKLFKEKSLKYVYVTLFLSILSALLFAFLYDPNNINRSYFGTDTRAFSMLIGSSLSFVNRSSFLREKINFKGKNSYISNILVILSIFLIFFFSLSLPGESAAGFFGIHFFYSILVGNILIFILKNNNSLLDSFLSNNFFQYIGKRSYGIYLYQLPVMSILDHTLYKYHFNYYLLSIFEILLIFLLAELSYKLIEKPFLYKKDKKNIFKKIFKNFKKLNILVLFLVFTSIFSVLSVDIYAITHYDKNSVEKITKTEKKITPNDEVKKEKSNQVEDMEYSFTQKDKDYLKNLKLFSVGDSVLLDAVPNLKELDTNMKYDGKVGRQVNDGIKILEQTDKNDYKDGLILTLGQNGSISNDQISEIYKLAKGSKIYWVNSHGVGRWVDSNNEVLNNFQKNAKNFYVIDWNKEISNKEGNSWISSDNVHPGEKGSKLLSNLIMKKIIETRQN